MSTYGNVSSITLPNDAVGWGLEIESGEGGAGWAKRTGAGVGTTGPGDVEAEEARQWVGGGCVRT